MRAPTLLSLDEGRRGRSDEPTPEDRSARRGSGRSTYARGDWQHGRPVAQPGRPGTDPCGGRARQASEGPIVPRKLGKGGGATPALGSVAAALAPGLPDPTLSKSLRRTK